jgi:hypothetical protein
MTDFPRRKQDASEGAGPLYHRKYRVELPVNRESALFTMALLQADINEFSPQLLARFEKRGGAEDKMSPGDCYQIYISGPWNGPVRVGEVKEDSFVLHTLEGHMEAGAINFRIEEEEGKRYFTIESVARSKDQVVDLLYDKIPVARLAQTTMWISVCRTFAAAALRVEKGFAERGLDPRVEIQTEKRKEGSPVWEAA